jgi:hypothetical protein
VDIFLHTTEGIHRVGRTVTCKTVEMKKGVGCGCKRGKMCRKTREAGHDACIGNASLTYSRWHKVRFHYNSVLAFIKD